MAAELLFTGFFTRKKSAEAGQQDSKTGNPACESKMMKILQKYLLLNSMFYAIYRIFLQKSVLQGVDGFRVAAYSSHHCC